MMLALKLCLLVGFAVQVTHSASPAVTEEKLQALEDKMLQKLNQVETSLELKLKEQEEEFKDQMALTGAKLENLERLQKTVKPSSGTSSSSKNPTRVVELTTQVTEIQGQIDKLLNQKNATLTPEGLKNHLNGVKSEIQILGTRLELVSNELKSELTGDISALNKVIQDQQVLLRKLELDARLKKREETVALLRTAFPGNITYTKALIANLNEDLDGAMPEIIAAIYKGSSSSFSQVSNLFEHLSATQRKAGIVRLNEAMQTRNLVDTPEFVQLAQYAKKHFGRELQSKFPISLQGLVWSKLLCLEERHTRTFLLINSTKVDNNYKVEGASTRSSQVCKWRFFPVNRGRYYTVSFNYRGGLLPKYWDLVSVGGQAVGRDLNKLITSTKMDADWQVETKKNGLALTLKLASQSPQYLCSTTSSTGQKTAVLSSTLGTSCEWLVDSLE